ncbi:MAG TPA: hypothetical protein VM639_00285 [Dongiaceae bacterium]|nr:hypothetical protein [Dongiaceae bacterium]
MAFDQTVMPVFHHSAKAAAGFAVAAPAVPLEAVPFPVGLSADAGAPAGCWGGLAPCCIIAAERRAIWSARLRSAATAAT